MSSPNDSFDDSRMEAVMGRLLQVGVLLASVVVALGGALYLKAHRGSVPDYKVFVSEPVALRDLGQIFEQGAWSNGFAVIELGVLLLIATPIARVVFAVVSFALERDWLYVVISVIVLVILVFGMVH
ncbi:MAG TPA: DUF1634 domain-containing protein, partial [Edaphobacter sp.]